MGTDSRIARQTQSLGNRLTRLMMRRGRSLYTRGWRRETQVMDRVLRPLVLSGGPAVGKTTAGRAIATARLRAAFIDADDIRQLVVAGASTLWSGPAGEAQHALATRNTASLAINFLADGFEVVIADFVTPQSLEGYRSLLPEAWIVHLAVSRDEARRRAKTRRIFLSDEEFELLHDMVREPAQVDVVLEVGDLSIEQQTEAIRAAWETAPHRRDGT